MIMLMKIATMNIIMKKMMMMKIVNHDGNVNYGS